ncbi:DUF4258 domain-containing protein [Candidatus Poriferisodalis sp.]|uniref:DUF4258 domain-containing protein n=1 Tax=Candidatus Poriferisodalis sp. TaxID=3101277 RepID=UPI003B5AF5A9
MELTYTQHARQQMERREISWSWVERVVASPTHRMRDPGDSTVERFYAPVPERDDRVLRAAVNTSSDPWRVVTVFFDRRMRGEA